MTPVQPDDLRGRGRTAAAWTRHVSPGPAVSLAGPGGDDLLLAAPEAGGCVRLSWLVDPKQQVCGYRVGWQAAAGDAPVAPLQAAVEAVAAHLVDAEQGWRLGSHILVFDADAGALAGIDWGGVPPGNVVLAWRSGDFVAAAHQGLLAGLRARGFGLMLCGAGALPADLPGREWLTHFDVGRPDPALVAAGRNAGLAPGRMVATRVADWHGVEVCGTLRLTAVLPCGEDAVPPAAPRELQPEAVLIVRVMQMLKRNEGLREIEAALKHDAALTYRLLRYINSPAISAGVEIQSLRHAVAMLGYAPLFRWLTLLLAASTSAGGSPPFLLKKAIMRGRFVELLGHELLGPAHADNLFLVGMFSVLGQLLGISTGELLEKVPLAVPVQSAVRDRKGIYGPFLSLAVACGDGAPEILTLAEELFISGRQLTGALLRATQWSQEVLRVGAR